MRTTKLLDFNTKFNAVKAFKDALSMPFMPLQPSSYNSIHYNDAEIKVTSQSQVSVNSESLIYALLCLTNQNKAKIELQKPETLMSIVKINSNIKYLKNLLKLDTEEILYQAWKLRNTSITIKAHNYEINMLYILPPCLNKDKLTILMNSLIFNTLSKHPIISTISHKFDKYLQLSTIEKSILKLITYKKCIDLKEVQKIIQLPSKDIKKATFTLKYQKLI